MPQTWSCGPYRGVAGFGLGVLSDVRVAKSIVVARRLEWTGSPGSRWGEDPAAAIWGSWR